MTTKEKALDYFSRNFHCSQAVLAAYADKCGLTEEQALRLGGCFGSGMRKGEVLVVGYGLLPFIDEELAKVEWSMLVLDEAQALKNAQTRRARSARMLRAGFKCALTGTPIENRIDDLWSIFSIINPGLLGSWDSFRKRWGGAQAGSAASRTLRALVRPFILRRLKSAVLSELPPRTEQTLVVEPTDEERAFYEAERRKAVDRIASLDEGRKRFDILARKLRVRPVRKGGKRIGKRLLPYRQQLTQAEKQLVLQLTDLKDKHHLCSRL